MLGASGWWFCWVGVVDEDRRVARLVAGGCWVCIEVFSSMLRSLGDDFSVLKFACACEEDCEGDNRRMAGRVAHKKTGVSGKAGRRSEE